MNWHFMMAGTASINPVMIVLSVLLILAWKTAGWWGLDRWLLPAVGTPWQTGRLPRFLANYMRRPGGGPPPSPGGGGSS
jgi:thiosulfate dehydrogenase [quinone] large subunit